MLRPWNWYKLFANKDLEAERDYLNRKPKAQFRQPMSLRLRPHHAEERAKLKADKWRLRTTKHEKKFMSLDAINQNSQKSWKLGF